MKKPAKVLIGISLALAIMITGFLAYINIEGPRSDSCERDRISSPIWHEAK